MINSKTKSRPYWVIEMCLSEHGEKSQIQVSFLLFAGDERRYDHQSYNPPECCAFPVCLQRHTHLAQVWRASGSLMGGQALGESSSALVGCAWRLPIPVSVRTSFCSRAGQDPKPPRERSSSDLGMYKTILFGGDAFQISHKDSRDNNIFNFNNTVAMQLTKPKPEDQKAWVWIPTLPNVWLWVSE